MPGPARRDRRARGARAAHRRSAGRSADRGAQHADRAAASGAGQHQDAEPAVSLLRLRYHADSAGPAAGAAQSRGRREARLFEPRDRRDGARGRALRRTESEGAMTDRYALLGNPVSHSKSPLIHGGFAKATGHDIEYGLIEAPLDGFAAAT